MMKQNELSPKYGNWISGSKLEMIMTLVVVFILMTTISFLPFVKRWIPDVVLLWVLRSLLLLLSCLSTWILYVFCRAYYIFSYDAGGLSGRIIRFVAESIWCEGCKHILDIGCGSGALTIEIAKRFPEAKVTGVDYWGRGWDYSKAQCERNAWIEGVNSRTVFMQGDAAKLPFTDGEFDVVVSNLTFHEVRSQPDKKQVIKEALRVVKPGGIFALHDLFYDHSKYGETKELEFFLKDLATDIHLKPTADEVDVPKGVFLKNIGMIYGMK